jgi:integron integrase
MDADLQEKWLQKMRVSLRLRNYSWKTEESYVRAVRHFWRAAETMPIAWTREQKLEKYLTDLVTKRDISASSQNVVLQAVLYFFKNVVKKPLGNIDAMRARRQPTQRITVDIDSTFKLLDAIQDRGGYPTKFIARLLYGCGLRITEALNLRVKDIDFKQSRIIIWKSKGDKSRVVPLPCQLVAGLQVQLSYAKGLWERDCANGLPVKLPGALAIKYKSYAHNWNWYYVFPGQKPCRHPRTGEWVRWRCIEENVQRAVRVAAIKVGLGGIITPHNLRHCFGTHVAASGQNMRALQQHMGHKSLETTMAYIHSDAMNVVSPLELTN